MTGYRRGIMYHVSCMHLYLPYLIIVTRKSLAVLDFKSQDALNILPFLIGHILNLLNITT